KDTDNWSTSWSGDGVASNNASWRVGFYTKFVDTHIAPSNVQMGTGGASSRDIQPHSGRPVFYLFCQVISLNKLTFFCVGAKYVGNRTIILWNDGRHCWRRSGTAILCTTERRLLRRRQWPMGRYTCKYGTAFAFH